MLSEEAGCNFLERSLRCLHRLITSVGAFSIRDASASGSWATSHRCLRRLTVPLLAVPLEAS